MRSEDQLRLVRVGPGTPAGELFRRYWQPAALSSELPERDGAPVRVRLLGEDLIAFRDTQGRVGLVDAYCPHRRAPLFFGRNEECGLRCVYHGWKFDVDGNCVDLPSEPADSPMKHGIRIKSYPTAERGGLVWAYLGPKALMPPEPDYEWTRVPETHRHVSKSYQACNYLQGLEGGLDTAHVSFLHNNKIGDRRNLYSRDGAPKIDVHETDYGYYYVSTRKVEAERQWVRVYQYAMPFQQMRPSMVNNGLSSNRAVPRADGHLWVPIDDEQTNVYNFCYGADQGCALDHDYAEQLEVMYGRGKNDYIPGTFKLKANLVERLLHRPRRAEGHELHRHQGHQHPGRRAAGRHGPDHRPHRGASRHLGPRHRGDAAPALGSRERGRARREPARQRRRYLSQHSGA